jgi:hypothetical protein
LRLLLAQLGALLFTRHAVCRHTIGGLSHVFKPLLFIGGYRWCLPVDLQGLHGFIAYWFGVGKTDHAILIHGFIYGGGLSG